MLNIQNGDQNIRVFFRHVEPSNPEKCRKDTICQLEITENEVTSVFRNVAQCSLGDNFCKATGRIISLARVLRDFGDRNFRKLILEAYLSRSIKNSHLLSHYL